MLRREVERIWERLKEAKSMTRMQCTKTVFQLKIACLCIVVMVISMDPILNSLLCPWPLWLQSHNIGQRGPFSLDDDVLEGFISPWAPCLQVSPCRPLPTELEPLFPSAWTNRIILCQFSRGKTWIVSLLTTQWGQQNSPDEYHGGLKLLCQTGDLQQLYSNREDFMIQRCQGKEHSGQDQNTYKNHS